MNKPDLQLQTAEKGTYLSITVYIFIAISKLVTGYSFNAHSLVADGLNNLTDIFSSAAVLYGLKTARKPADENHPYGHWKAEPIASLATSFVMLLVGLQVLRSSLESFINQEFTSPSMPAVAVGLISFILMMAVYIVNARLAKDTNSSGLKAVAKDNLADALTSLLTAAAIFTSSFAYAWIDLAMAILVAIIILKTGVQIFIESSFMLSDGFHREDLKAYRMTIETLPKVSTVHQIKGRMYGANIYVDVTIGVDGNMSVQEGHDITEEVEKILYQKHNVMFCDVHVEPKNIIQQFSSQQV